MQWTEFSPGRSNVWSRVFPMIHQDTIVSGRMEAPALPPAVLWGQGTVVRLLERSAAIAVLILLWEALPSLGFVDEFLLPTFRTVLKCLSNLFLSGEMFRHIGASLGRSAVGFTLAVSVSVPLGILMGWFKGIERFMDPLIQASRNTSTLALYPVFILVFGLGESSKISIIIWGSIWPVLLNTISGVKGVDPLLVKLARSMGVSPFGVLWRVVLPMSLPSILTGLRLSAAASILMLVAAEMLGADRGLGFMVFYYQERYAIPEMFAGILSISVLGLLINSLLIRLEARLTQWKERASHA